MDCQHFLQSGRAYGEKALLIKICAALLLKAFACVLVNLSVIDSSIVSYMDWPEIERRDKHVPRWVCSWRSESRGRSLHIFPQISIWIIQAFIPTIFDLNNSVGQQIWIWKTSLAFHSMNNAADRWVFMRSCTLLGVEIPFRGVAANSFLFN